MSIIELFIIAIGLSMDAFAVSVCKGLSVSKIKKIHMIKAGMYFGGFQALMPLIGYFLGIWFREFIVSFDHWITFILLGVIGINMIRESFAPEEKTNSSFKAREMIMLALATSIDALAVGVTFAFLDVNIIMAIFLIGLTTFAFSCAGVKIGNIFGEKYKSKAELAGGIILILLGVKILIEHLFFS